MESNLQDSDDGVPKRSFFRKALDQLNPVAKVKHIKQVIQEHGWKLAIWAIGFEVVEHLVVPSALAFTFGPEFFAAASIPWGEFLFYPLLLKYYT